MWMHDKAPPRCMPQRNGPMWYSKVLHACLERCAAPHACIITHKACHVVPVPCQQPRPKQFSPCSPSIRTYMPHLLCVSPVTGTTDRQKSPSSHELICADIHCGYPTRLHQWRFAMPCRCWQARRLMHLCLQARQKHRWQEVRRTCRVGCTWYPQGAGSCTTEPAAYLEQSACAAAAAAAALG
jgi:hypothetical protein